MSGASQNGPDLPLMAWGDELRRRKIARRRLRLRLGMVGGFSLIMMASAMRSLQRAFPRFAFLWKRSFLTRRKSSHLRANITDRCKQISQAPCTFCLVLFDVF